MEEPKTPKTDALEKALEMAFADGLKDLVLSDNYLKELTDDAAEDISVMEELKGEKGDKGDQGEQGIQGVQGEKGQKGDKGAKGDKGEKGDTGPQGERGEKGESFDSSIFNNWTEDEINAMARRATVTDLRSLTDVDIGNITNGEILIFDSSIGKFVPGSNDAGSPLTTKGDLYTHSTVDTRLPVGTNGQFLVADSGEATGLKWVDSLPDQGIQRIITTTTGNTTAGAVAQRDYVYYVPAGHTITLPTAVGNTNRYTIVRTGTSTVPIATTGGQTINGAASPTNLTRRYTSVDLMSDGSNWFIS